MKRFGESLKAFFGRNWHYTLVIVFGVILSMGLWGYIMQITTGDDFAFHAMRLQGSAAAWGNGQILPQVHPEALGGFGYAYNIFYGPIVTYIAAVLQFLTTGAIAVNLTLMILLMASGVLMCWAMMRIGGNKFLAALTAILYMAAPYHLTDLYSRMAVGEVAALTVAPILLCGLYELTNHESKATRHIAIAAALLLLSHSLSAALFALMSAIYVLFNIKAIWNKKSIGQMALAVVVALGLAAFFLLPMLEVRGAANYGVFDAGYLEQYFGANGQSMNDHRIWPFSLLLTDSYVGELDLATGVVAVTAMIGFWFVRKRIEDQKQRKFVTILYAIAILSLIVMMPIIDWHHMPLMMRQLQFPWRMLEIFTVAMSMVAGYTIYELIRDVAEEKRKLLVVVAGMVALYPMIGTFVPRKERQVWDGEGWKEVASGSVGWQAEYVPMQMLCSPDNEEETAQGFACSLGKVKEILAERGSEIEVISGTAKVSGVERDGLKFQFQLENRESTEAEVELPVIYYPGYVAKLDGKKVTVKESERLGLATVVVPAEAAGEVEVYYGLSRATVAGMAISGATVVLGGAWIATDKRHAEWGRKLQAKLQK